MTFQCLSVHDARWMDVIAVLPEATVFHHPAWIDLMAECYGYEAYLGAILDGSESVLVGLPFMEVDSWLTGRRIVALPFSDFCPPLTAHDSGWEGFVREFRAWQSQRGGLQATIHWPLPQQEGVYPGKPYLCHATPLDDDAEAVRHRFKKTRVQQPIRQAVRKGVVVTRGESWDDVQMFYKLHMRTRRRLGAPVQPLRFFRILWEKLLAQDLGFVLLARQDSQLLAGAVFLCWNQILTYKYSASDPQYWRMRPNHLLLWHAIRWGCEQGYSVFDWGRTDPRDKGLCDFKRGWGSQESTLHYSVLADQPPSDGGGLSHTHALLSAVIQRSPTWVGRLVGEFLYGHFA
jgi:lipid II:glycine glycyltransferase (peptidoglycan interpeptide bridge formation enzyme)